MIDEVSDTLGWDRKHTIKALNGKFSLGIRAKKRGSKPIYDEEECGFIVAIWMTQRATLWRQAQADAPFMGLG